MALRLEAAAASCLSCGVCGQGRPIYIQHLGQINMKKMYEVTTEERMLKFHVQEYERCARYIMPACSIVAGRHIDQTFAVIDLKGARGGCALDLPGFFLVACKTLCVQSRGQCRARGGVILQVKGLVARVLKSTAPAARACGCLAR